MSGAYDRTYSAIKAWIIHGELKPGQRIEIHGIEEKLKVSTSPIREALSALVTEFMVEAIKGAGFRVSACDLAATSDLLDWRQYLSAVAVKSSPGSRVSLLDTRSTDHATRTVQFFDSLARLSKNGEVRRAMANTNDRLHHVHRLESLILVDASAELTELEAALRDGDRDLKKILRRYHHRRIVAAPSIVKLVRDEYDRPIIEPIS